LPKNKGAGGAECLPNKCKVLGSIPITTKKRKEMKSYVIKTLKGKNKTSKHDKEQRF
jgi:hypothetical protein